jgi:hypothetical protein
MGRLFGAQGWAESLPGSAGRFRQDGQTDCFTKERNIRMDGKLQPVLNESMAFETGAASEETVFACSVTALRQDCDTVYADGRPG